MQTTPSPRRGAAPLQAFFQLTARVGSRPLCGAQWAGSTPCRDNFPPSAVAKSVEFVSFREERGASYGRSIIDAGNWQARTSRFQT
jgi:hypothetical protein